VYEGTIDRRFLRLHRRVEVEVEVEVEVGMVESDLSGRKDESRATLDTYSSLTWLHTCTYLSFQQSSEIQSHVMYM
jgi:hypothetical protein